MTTRASSANTRPAHRLPGTPSEPEKRLMLAVLEDALDVYFRYRGHRRNRRLFRETEAWFFSDDTDWPFAYRNVCAVLGVDPVWLRRQLAAWCRHATELRALARAERDVTAAVHAAVAA